MLIYIYILYIYIYLKTKAKHLLLLHFCWPTSSTYFLHFLFFPPILHIYIYIYIFFSLLVYTYYYTFPNLSTSSNLSPPFLPLHLPTTLHFTVTLHFFFLYFDSSSSHFILYKFDMISPIQFMYFLTKKKIKLWVLSLSLSLWIFVLSYNSD